MLPIDPPGAAARFRAAWASRPGTDYLFLQPVVNVVLVVVTCGIFGLYLFYQLVRRSRDHNRRRLDLLDAATTVAWEAAHGAGLGETLRPEFERIAVHLQTLRARTTEFRDPAIWLLILLVAGTVGQIVAFVLLDQDLVVHDTAEVAIEADLAAIYTRLGAPIPTPDPTRVKGNDDYVARVVVSVVTCGIYTLWWLVDQQRDGDRHCIDNWSWEDALAAAVEQVGGTPRAAIPPTT